MAFQKLTLKDKALFERFLNACRHELAVYNFANIYVWKELFDIFWRVKQGHLCVFFKDRMGSFLYLPPLSLKPANPSVLRWAFAIMDGFNKNSRISRIENVEKEQVDFYRKLGYKITDKPGDYLYARQDLAQLRGNRFKSKRSSLNYFKEHYQYEYFAYFAAHKKACFKLYADWMRSRQAASHDPVYRGMLQDCTGCLKLLLNNYSRLGVTGRLVEIAGEIKAFTFGYALNKQVFCILYEITDLSIKGLAQFIFWQFCAELKNYRYINAMDDSGLENLKKVKLSYKPAKVVGNYIVTRGNA